MFLPSCMLNYLQCLHSSILPPKKEYIDPQTRLSYELVVTYNNDVALFTAWHYGY